MPPSTRLRLQRIYENNLKEKLTAKNQSSPFETPIKRQALKPINGDHPTTQPEIVTLPKQLDIVDLNYDCLEHIFNDFCLTDLIAIGRTCTTLQLHACTYFASKFKKHHVVINCDRYPHYSITIRAVKQNGNDIAAFMFAFGTVITKLTIQHMSPIAADSERMECDVKVQNLIENYCRKNLQELRFQRCGKRTMYQAQPFDEVTYVSFDQCTLGHEVVQFEYLFPKMRKLEVVDCDVRCVRDSIEREFPQLEYFNLVTPFGEKSWFEMSFTIANVKAAFERNPNIKSLNLCHWNLCAYDAKLLKHAAVHLHQLKSLRLWHLRYTDFASDGDIHFPSVINFTLENFYQHSGSLERNLAALSFDNLRKFSIIGQFDNECTSFIARHKTINQLSITPNGEHKWCLSDEDVMKMLTLLPKLEKITLDCSQLTPAGLVQLVTAKHSSLALVKLHRYRFSAAIRKLFLWKCAQSKWNAVGTASEQQIVLKRQAN